MGYLPLFAISGWIVKLKLSNPAELEQLLSEDAYKKHIETADH